MGRPHAAQMPLTCKSCATHVSLTRRSCAAHVVVAYLSESSEVEAGVLRRSDRDLLGFMFPIEDTLSVKSCPDANETLLCLSTLPRSPAMPGGSFARSIRIRSILPAWNSISPECVTGSRAIVLATSAQTLPAAIVRATSLRELGEFGPSWPRFDQLARVGPIWARFGPSSTKLRKPELATCRPKLLECWTCVPKLCRQSRIKPELGLNRSNLRQLRPSSPNCGKAHADRPRGRKRRMTSVVRHR